MCDYEPLELSTCTLNSTVPDIKLFQGNLTIILRRIEDVQSAQGIPQFMRQEIKVEIRKAPSEVCIYIYIYINTSTTRTLESTSVGLNVSWVFLCLN